MPIVERVLRDEGETMPVVRKRSVPLGGRPTEYGSGAVGAIAFLVGLAFHLSADTVLALVLVLGAVPGAITWVVELWRRRG